MTYELYEQDCITWMKTQPAESVDIILTSPPYNFDMPYGTYKDDITDYRSWTTAWIAEANRVLKDRGRFIINIQPKYSTGEPYHCWVNESMEQNSMLYYGDRIWQKNSLSGYHGAAGAMGTSTKPYLWYSTEQILFYAKGDRSRPTKRTESLITIKEQVAWARHHIWSIAPAKQKDHPAQMPKELALRCLKLFARKGDVVYDPFAGAGTTMLAAKELGLDSIGTEIDPDYCDLIRKRLQ